MNSISPTAEGFRVVFRRPSIPLAEIAWRWSVTGAAWFLGAMFLLEYADTLPVSPLERLMLATRQPVLILRAIRRIFEGSAFRFSKAGVLLAIALVVAWIALASLGRAVVLRSLIEERDPGGGGQRFRGNIWRLMELNFLRAAVGLATVIASFGSLILASSLWASTHASVGDAARLWIALLFTSLLAWAILNWFLSTAAVFIVAEGQSSFAAVASTMSLCKERTGSVLAPSIWFGLAHFGAFITASGAVFTVLSAGEVIGARLVLLMGFLLAIVYSAAVDCLYVGRLAAYLTIIRQDEAAELSQPMMELPKGPQDTRSAVDPGELILSDVPSPAG
jgi:hypothetical protein